MNDNPTETDSLAKSFLPMLTDDGFGDTTSAKRAEYLSKRICNFSVRESCQLADVSEKTVRRWRDADPDFFHLDTKGMTDLRKKFATEYVDMQFTRNFHLVLQKDFKVLYEDAIGGTLTKEENDYLGKIRAHYTPQSLAIVKQLLGGGTTETPFSYTKLVMEIKQERIEITQGRDMNSGD
ncbi:hypothetical protein LCGC14_0383130 [marine sediment metagenome]|uniref:Uncharacterized protein n=1 Tax=marine sediment metagenome TaxID=412755 RepID=A0A0F9T7I6_9ZZZZ